MSKQFQITLNSLSILAVCVDRIVSDKVVEK